MTRVLILGGGGMIGQKLMHHLVREGLNNAACDITLCDLAFPSVQPKGVSQIKGSLTDPEIMRTICDSHFDIVFHLAAVVSGEAEADFDKGWSVNMQTMWHLLSGLREKNELSGGTYCPRIVFTSSIAVFGGPYPSQVGDNFLSAPQTSYGAQKSMCEILLSEFSRKGFVDGLSLRLPTICVRPGKPNKAASSFFSGIIREPLNGQKAVLPVADTVRHWHASPRTAVGFLVHAAQLETARLKGRRALNLPGISCTVAEQIEALRRIAGQSAVDLIRIEHDPKIAQIVSGWPRDFNPERALELGFCAETSFEQIIQAYLEDDFRGSVN